MSGSTGNDAVDELLKIGAARIFDGHVREPRRPDLRAEGTGRGVTGCHPS
jgi:hypothetical protein